MPSTNVIMFPSSPTPCDNSHPLILCAVSDRQGNDSISYEYCPKLKEWFFDIRATTIDDLISSLLLCKRAINSPEKAVAQ